MVKINFFTSFFKNIAFPIGAFFLAMLLWLFVVSGDQYTMMLDLPFKSYILQNYSDIKLVLDLDGISQEYEFILNDYFEKNPRKVVIPPSHNVSFIEVVYPNRINIRLDEVMEKKVPIISNIRSLVKDGYLQIGNTQFEPDSLVIIGPKVELNKINEVHTAKDTLFNLSKSIRGTIDLISQNRLIKFSLKKINYFLLSPIAFLKG